MKILVLSDSHGRQELMRYAVHATKPNAIIHLGDHFDDATELSEAYPHLTMHQVPGNCDYGRIYGIHPETICYKVCGVTLFMTHGHNHDVKQSLSSLLWSARSSSAEAALFGHTHIPYCDKEPGGLWVLNPGSCRSLSGSVGLIEVEDHQILSCRILRLGDLEEML